MTGTGAITRMREIEAEVGDLRRMIEREALPANDRRYVDRCIELLQMELDALREYIEGPRNPPS